MLSEHAKVKKLLDYRLQAVFGLMWALELRSCWNTAPPISIFINEHLTVEGNLSAITNPMIEAGFIHCRALLEFLGLQRSKDGKTIQALKRREGDIGIEHFKNADGLLKMRLPDVVLSRYLGPPEKAENSFLGIIEIANKHLLHNTISLLEENNDVTNVEFAIREMPALMTNYFYTPLGLLPPTPWITTRPREAL